jgi:hypothetical protein
MPHFGPADQVSHTLGNFKGSKWKVKSQKIRFHGRLERERWRWPEILCDCDIYI